MSHTNKSSPKFMWSREKGKVGRRASFFDFVISRAKKSLFLFQDIQPHPYSTCKSHNHWSPAPWSSSEILKITGNLSLSSDFWFCFFFFNHYRRRVFQRFSQNRSLFKSGKLDSCPGVLWGSSSRDRGLLEGEIWELGLQLIQAFPFFTIFGLVFPCLNFIQIFVPDELKKSKAESLLFVCNRKLFHQVSPLCLPWNSLKHPDSCRIYTNNTHSWSFWDETQMGGFFSPYLRQAKV